VRNQKVPVVDILFSHHYVAMARIYHVENELSSRVFVGGGPGSMESIERFGEACVETTSGMLLEEEIEEGVEVDGLEGARDGEGMIIGGS
jgi:hypothetical protein